jgi:hypothetical protein
MEYTESQLAEFKEEFARRRRRQWILTAMLVVVALSAVLAQDRRDGSIGGLAVVVWLPIFFAVVIAGVVVSLRTWRCPACGGYLGKAMRLNFCPRCGVALR